jgi:hypothetical protein
MSITPAVLDRQLPFGEVGDSLSSRPYRAAGDRSPSGLVLASMLKSRETQRERPELPHGVERRGGSTVRIGCVICDPR